jgi:CBS domain-containing protein
MTIAEEYPYQLFPFVRENRVERLVSRQAILKGNGDQVTLQPALTVSPDVTVKEAVTKMVSQSASLLVLTAKENGHPIRSRSFTALPLVLARSRQRV